MTHSLNGNIIAVGGITTHQYKQLVVNDIVTRFMKNFGKFEMQYSYRRDYSVARYAAIEDLEDIQPYVRVRDPPLTLNEAFANETPKFLPKSLKDKLNEKNTSVFLMINSGSHVSFYDADLASEIFYASSILADKLRAKKSEMELKKEFLLLFDDENRIYTPSGFKRNL